MKYIYFWIVLFFLCGHGKVQGSGGTVPRRMNDIYHRELKSAPVQKSLSVAKHAGRRHANDVENSSRRLFGRHVCSQNKVRMLPLKEMQSYCKPAYQSYIRRCDKDNSHYCTGYRVVYELAYRAVQRMVAKTESLYSCCPGWSQARISATDCKKAICREECKNGGTCTKPDHCTCLPGWTGKTCESDIDECSKKHLNLCEQDCINLTGSYKCLCKEGFTLQSDGRSCKREESKIQTEYDEALLKKMEVMQKRLDDLEEWRRISTEKKTDDTSHQRDDRINSLSEQIAILEERLEECTCNKRDEIIFPRPQK